ncbi:MAG: PilZ domain-containing protein [Deltaproteobacteria bacterium]|nr:PilZ domain-containing protein [Deltaproteobacteria bacterium]
MEDTFRFHDRRDSIRLKMDYPVLYTRFDNQGRECDQKISRSMDVSLGGVRLQSSFLVDSGEALDITMALGENLVTFKGKVAYVSGSEDQGFELGISIEDIEDQDKISLTRFIYYFRGSSQRGET